MATITASRQLAAFDVLDGLSAIEQIVRLRRLYLGEIRAGGEAPSAEQRGTMLAVARRMGDSIDPADILIQACQEQVDLVVATPEALAKFEEIVGSPPLSDHLRPEDAIQVAKDRLQAMRAFLGEERERMPADLEQLRGGRRPDRALPDEPGPESLEELSAREVGEALAMAGAAALAGGPLAGLAVVAAELGSDIIESAISFLSGIFS